MLVFDFGVLIGKPVDDVLFVKSRLGGIK